ncbi:ABC-2 family transporter protein [Caprobacter fermentans]|uniref:ABC-2 family transporter protein n=1 Tax=Caproicibacter fermentans TaxID=2576756 RepID=A0A6N8I2D6_9FIRM|nr:ABC transporter permease [Caproicibacter fermentans]MVB12286.1 ABC-2 family transporter protein [Caproicibacter fermentans]OCN02669.1 transporter [Clostridium sp. W14A]
MNLILTEFQKLKRYSVILVGMIGATCSPVISIVMQNIMSDDAKSVLNYTFPDLINSTIWNNMTIFFPMILALIGGYMISREYTDDTLKSVMTVPVSFPRLMTGKLTALGIIALLLGLYAALVTLLVGLISCRENLTLPVVLSGSVQMTAMALFTCIGELPLIALCGRKQGAFRGGAVAAFLLGYVSIFLKNPVLRNLYPLSAGLSIVGFGGEGFVSDTAGSYASTQNAFMGTCVILAMILLTAIIIHHPGKDTAAAPKKGGRSRHNRQEATK